MHFLNGVLGSRASDAVTFAFSKSNRQLFFESKGKGFLECPGRTGLLNGPSALCLEWFQGLLPEDMPLGVSRRIGMTEATGSVGDGRVPSRTGGRCRRRGFDSK